MTLPPLPVFAVMRAGAHSEVSNRFFQPTPRTARCATDAKSLQRQTFAVMFNPFNRHQ